MAGQRAAHPNADSMGLREDDGRKAEPGSLLLVRVPENTDGLHNFSSVFSEGEEGTGPGEKLWHYSDSG